jgi:hypothetical protein
VANPDRSITIKNSVAAMDAAMGPAITHYNMPLDMPALFKWIVGDTTTADDVTVISHQGGTPGRWHRVRLPIKGADLTDADEDVGVGGNYWRVLPAATPLTDNRIKTLVTTNAAEGDLITITRLGLGSYTMAIANGGAGAGTLFTLPSGAAWWCRAYFDGTDWLAHSAGALP